MRKPLTVSDSADDRDPVVAAVRAEVARRDKRLQDAAEVLELSPSAFTRRLRGDVEFTVPEVRKLARWLGVPVSALVHDVDLADVGAAQPSALGVAVAFLLAVLIGVTLPTGTPVALLVTVAGGWVLVGCVRGAIAAERVAAARGRRD